MMGEDDLRLVGLAGPAWLTMLERRERNIIARIHSDFRSGKIDFLATVAELVSVREQSQEIRSAMRANDGRQVAPAAGAADGNP